MFRLSLQGSHCSQFHFPTSEILRVNLAEHNAVLCLIIKVIIEPTTVALHTTPLPPDPHVVLLFY